jgi:transposase
MVILGIDAHKQTHTVVVVDEHGRKLGERTVKTTTTDHLDLLVWASRFGTERRWAVEDCRHLSRRLERDLLGAGQQVVRVPPKLMANARTAGRTYGKSDPIDALAVARAALREPELPVARLDGPARELRLLVDHRDDLVAERTRVINRLRWHLHELDPSWQPPARSLSRAPATHLAATEAFLSRLDGMVARLAGELLARVQELNAQIDQLEADLVPRVRRLAPSLLALRGCGVLTAAKLVARPPTSGGSTPRTPTPATTAPPRCRSGRPTNSAIGSAVPATGSSTWRCTASPSPRPATTLTPSATWPAAAPTATPPPRPSAP